MGGPSDVKTKFGLDAGAGGRIVIDTGGGCDGLEDEKDTVGDKPPSEVNTSKLGLDVGAAGGVVVILVEPVLSTVGPELGAEFMPS